MNTIFFNSKEEIANRMLRNAQDFWGVSNKNDIDPFVKIIIEALSNELFNVSNDVKNMETRVLNKISRILASDYLVSALPSHAILTARSIENEEQLTVNNHFFYKKNVVSSSGKANKDSTDIFFTPLGETKVFNADIKYLANGNYVCDYESPSHKTNLISSKAGHAIPQNTLWIGIDCAIGVNSLKDMGLFFEWPSYSANKDFYKLLEVVKCYLEEDEISTVHGLNYKADGNKQSIFYEQNIVNQITGDIKAYYDNRFISITDDRLANLEHLQNAAFPQQLNNYFEARDLQRLKPCVWLKLTFPAAINAQMIDELQVAINCFPVMNRKRYEKKYRLKDYNNILPMNPADQEHFLAVKDLRDDRNVIYNETPFSNASHDYQGSYSIRNGGAERFDNRDAQQLIKYLFELMRDEKAAFSVYGNDFINGILKTMEQNLSLIETKTNSIENERINYLVLKPNEKTEMVYLQYWTTLAEQANHVRNGSRLQQFESIKFKQETVRMMTTSLGGRNSLGSFERIQAYKYGLTTKDRIVTEADLKAFCFYELGKQIENVTIAKGIAISENPNEGLKKTTDVYLTPTKDVQLSKEEWDILTSLLLSKLVKRSTINMSLRIFVQ